MPSSTSSSSGGNSLIHMENLINEENNNDSQHTMVTIPNGHNISGGHQSKIHRHRHKSHSKKQINKNSQESGDLSEIFDGVKLNNGKRQCKNPNCRCLEKKRRKKLKQQLAALMKTKEEGQKQENDKDNKVHQHNAFEGSATELLIDNFGNIDENQLLEKAKSALNIDFQEIQVLKFLL